MVNEARHSIGRLNMEGQKTPNDISSDSTTPFEVEDAVNILDGAVESLGQWRLNMEKTPARDAQLMTRREEQQCLEGKFFECALVASYETSAHSFLRRV